MHVQTFFYNSFLPSTIRAWNELADEIKAAPSVACFKFRLNRNLTKPPKYYNSGTRQGQIIHARLRMQCSSLNADLYRKNIVPSPSCTCGEFESAYHFFFKCTNYSLARSRYLPNNLNELNTNDLLCGLSNVPDYENATSQLTNVQSTKSEVAVTVRKKSVSCFTPTCVNTLKTCIFFSIFVLGITVFER